MTDRLFEPARLKRFCPGEHCAKPCTTSSCTCAPCFPSCAFCKARKLAARVSAVLETVPNRQLHLPTGRAWK